ncbi:transcription antitermination protein NusB [Mycoplasmopsis pullorum]|uniref:transcription antitermination protein NusB n=1 Tax=Mycoplasmopsis pullorum TaxID=48003 RepID=UPI0011191A38|nr:transcription antitermination protein NusB [Mycoplasmopsis pullorum]TNK85628.1 transcription antitermination protein NusB [Mycoplasmopsis pullorum]
MDNSPKLKNRRKLRKELVQVVYSFMLFNEKVNHLRAFEEFDFLDREQIEFLKYLENNQQFFQNLIIKFSDQNWPWDRIDPVVRAILLVACVEFFRISQPKIVINEAIEMVKSFFIPESLEVNKYAKFVNAVLQNIYKLLVIYESKELTKQQK